MTFSFSSSETILFFSLIFSYLLFYYLYYCYNNYIFIKIKVIFLFNRYLFFSSCLLRELYFLTRLDIKGIFVVSYFDTEEKPSQVKLP